jgi:putative FmdB family regulatory protein
MPIYEFACHTCQCHFETRVARIGDRPAACPSCGGTNLEKQLSTFAAHTSDGASASRAVSPCEMGQACCAVQGGGCASGMN